MTPNEQRTFEFADAPSFAKQRKVKQPEVSAWVERLKLIKINEKARLAAEQEQDSKCNSIATAAEVRVKG